VAINTYIKTAEKSQVNNQSLYHKELEKPEQTKPKISRRKEMIKIRSETNDRLKKQKEYKRATK
jgi:hypothetical protein